MAQLRADDGFSSAPDDYVASAKHNVSGGSLHGCRANRRLALERGQKWSSAAKACRFATRKPERGIIYKSTDMVEIVSEGYLVDD